MKINFPVVVRMENFTSLFYKFAIKCWNKLPNAHKTWVSVEDLVQDGMVFARFKLVPNYDVRRAAFITILQMSLEQFYSRKLRALYRKKRMPIEIKETEQEERVQQEDVSVAVSQAAVEKVYLEASPLLKEYMGKWFFKVGGGVRRIRISEPFKQARNEFQLLAMKHNVTPENCRVYLENRK